MGKVTIDDRRIGGERRSGVDRRGGAPKRGTSAMSQRAAAAGTTEPNLGNMDPLATAPRVSAGDLARSTGRWLHTAQRTPIVIERFGIPSTVLISHQQFEDLVALANKRS